jgi:hypothetical protein
MFFSFFLLSLYREYILKTIYYKLKNKTFLSKAAASKKKILEEDGRNQNIWIYVNRLRISF